MDGGTLALTKYLTDESISVGKKLFNIVAYRFFNRRDTIENLFGGLLDPENFDFEAFEARFDAKRNQESLFSNAYLISSHPYNAAYRPKDKHVQVLLMLAGYGRENKRLLPGIGGNAGRRRVVSCGKACCAGRSFSCRTDFA